MRFFAFEQICDVCLIAVEACMCALRVVCVCVCVCVCVLGIVLDRLTEYCLNNVQRIWKPEYKPNDKDIKMIDKYYAKNIEFKRQERLYKMYDCDLNPSKWSHFYDVACIFYIVDLTGYGNDRTIEINQNNKITKVSEMQAALNNFQTICKIKLCGKFHFV